MHNCFENPIANHDQPWYTFVTLQQGHNQVAAVDHWLDQYNAQPPRAILEDESNYEMLISEYGGGAEWKTRQSMWQSQVGGAFGYTYGGQGVWWGCYDFDYQSFNCGPVGSAEYKVWYQTLEFPVGSQQAGFMKQLWTSFAWWEMAPDAAAIVWSAAAPGGTQRPYQKAMPDRSVVVAYLPQVKGCVGSLFAIYFV